MAKPFGMKAEGDLPTREVSPLFYKKCPFVCKKCPFALQACPFRLKMKLSKWQGNMYSRQNLLFPVTFRNKTSIQSNVFRLRKHITSTSEQLYLMERSTSVNISSSHVFRQSALLPFGILADLVLCSQS